MTKIKHFLKKEELRHYTIQGVNLKLYIDTKIFPPSPHGSMFGKHIKIKPGETVIDIGTGSGLLAILASKLGAKKVYTTDISIDATKITKINSYINGTANLECLTGKFFVGLQKKFDVIIANLPQEIIPPSYKMAIGILDETINGGVRGNNILLEFLDIVSNHMHKNTRLYIPIVTLSNYEKTISTISKKFNARLIAFSPVKTKEFVNEFQEYYKRLKSQGFVDLFKRKDNWMVHEYIFELKKKEKTHLFQSVF